MKKINFLLLAAVIIFFNSCNMPSVNVSTANLSGAKMCEALNNDECSIDNPVFAQNSKSINLSVTLNNAPEDTKVDFTWYAIDSVRIKISEVTADVSSVQNSGSTYILHSTIEMPESGWPIGEYEVEAKIKTDNAKPLVKKFSVK